MELFCTVFPSRDLALSITAFGWSIDGVNGLSVPGLSENQPSMATPRNAKRGVELVHPGGNGFEGTREVARVNAGADAGADGEAGDTGDGSHDGSLPAGSKTEMRPTPG